MSWSKYTEDNNTRRKLPTKPPQTLTLRNVSVYRGGDTFEGPTEIHIHGGKIVESVPTDAEALDCTGKFLIPGLINSHSHPDTTESLEELTKNGVTTVMAMAGLTAEHMASLKDHNGLCNVHNASRPALSPENKHVQIIPGWPQNEFITEASEADAWVDGQIKKGAEYIKIISDVPGIGQDVISAVVEASKKRGLRTVIHAATSEPVRMALNAKPDQIHHCALDALLFDEDIKQFRDQGTVLCPTMSMMEMLGNSIPSPKMDYGNAKANLTALHKAGVVVLCGDDTHTPPKEMAGPLGGSLPFGTSMHHELELCVQAGLSPAEALRTATVLPAKYFGFEDRGEVEVGRRADLVLLGSDPLKDIKADGSVEEVWVGGVEYA